MDAESGTVLFESQPDRQWPPASMVKIMMMLLVMERVTDGRLDLDEPVTTSAWASRMGGSQVYLRDGEVFSLREMLKALVIASANDAAVAIAEHVAGTTEAFVDLMNARRRELGLENTTYHTVHGLPPGRGEPDDLSSAYDLALLAGKVITYPQILEWSSMSDAPFRNGTFKLTNTNALIRSYRGANGLKTGFHQRARFGVTATARRGELTLIAVVLGAPTKKASSAEAARLLTLGFATYRAVRATEKGRPVGAMIPVEGGDVQAIRAVARDNLRLLLKRAEAPDVQVEARLPHLLTAPIRNGQRVGEVVVVSGSTTFGTMDLVADRDVTAVGWLGWWRNWWGPADVQEQR
jgi:D-alanyl-D-alanine carboxypeptidase (penicillin-binding protein 5/6)